MKYTVVGAVIFLVSFGLLHAEETHNLEVIFKRTNWNQDSILTYGYSLSTAGDVNQDGYDDIVYLVMYDSWDIRGYLFYGGNPMDTLYDVVLHGEAGEQGQVCSGDVNGDSIVDIIIGQPYGVVQIYYGSGSMDSLPDLKIHGEVYAEEFGCAVACGDVNGDGCDDIVVGAYAYDGFTLDGRVYVYYGGALLDSLPDVIIEGHNSEAFGKSVGSGGDLNSDGFEDIVVGADENSEAYPGAGKVYVFFGGNPMNTVPDCWLHGEGVNHYLGWFNVDIINNFDSYGRVISGTKLWPNGFMSVNNGKVYILDGGEPPDTIVDAWMVGRGDSSFLGQWSTAVSKANSDDWGEALSGAPGDPPNPYGLGMGYLWMGDSLIDTIPDGWLKGRYYGDGIGRRVASAGDVNGDGCDEVMFSNYTGMEPAVWVCRYTGPGIQEHASQIAVPLIQVEPNPFSHILNIDYNNGRDNNVNMRIFDISGREVMRHVLKDKTRVSIDTRSLPSGVYFVMATAGNTRAIRKVVKIK